MHDANIVESKSCNNLALTQGLIHNVTYLRLDDHDWSCIDCVTNCLQSSVATSKEH